MLLWCHNRLECERSFPVARLNIDDVKLTVVFVNQPMDPAAWDKAAFGGGGVATVWPDQHGRTRFCAEPVYHAFLQTVDYANSARRSTGRFRCRYLKDDA